MSDRLNLNARQWALCDWVALSVCVISFFAWFRILLDKFFYFGYYDWDFALYANAMWNLTHGSSHPSLFGTNFLTNHAEYISFFLVPLYWLFGHPFLLIILKLFSFVAGSFVFYLIAKRNLGWPIAVLLMLLYQTYPANLFMIIYEFHFESLAIVFIFLLYYFLTNQKLGPFLITAFFAGLIKENIALIVATFGIYAIFTKRENKLAWIMGPLLWGGGIFALSMFVITPHLRMQEGINSANQYIGFYWTNPGGNTHLAQVILSNLHNAWANMSSPLNISFIKELFGPLNFLPLLSLRTLFLGTPVLLQNFLASARPMHTIHYHYAATATAFIFLSVVTSFTFLKERFRGPAFYFIVILTSLTCIINSAVNLPELKGRMVSWPPVCWQMINKIPPQAGVVASFPALSPLSQRESLFAFYNIWTGVNVFTGKQFQLPPDVTYAFLDMEDHWLLNDLRYRPQGIMPRVRAFFSEGNWTVEDAVEDIVLFRKNGRTGPKLVGQSNAPFLLDTGNQPLMIDGKFRLLDSREGETTFNRPSVLPLTFFWKSDQDISDAYFMNIMIKDERSVVFSRTHRVGYIIRPTDTWRKGEYIKEHYWLLLPPLSPGEYTFAVSLVNMTKRSAAQLVYENQTGSVISLMKFRVNHKDIRSNEK